MSDDTRPLGSQLRGTQDQALVMAAILGTLYARRLSNQMKASFNPEKASLSDLNLGDSQAIYHPDQGDVFFTTKYGYEPVGECLIADAALVEPATDRR